LAAACVAHVVSCGAGRWFTAMRVLIHDFAGHPFQVELSRELGCRGHTVLHAYSPDVTTGQGRLTISAADPAGLRICPVTIGRRFSRYSTLRRPRDEIAYGRALARRIDAFAPDAVISANTPLISQRHAHACTDKRGAAFVYWVQDLLGVGTAIHLRRRLGPVGRLAGHGLKNLEQQLLMRSDALVAITDGFLPLLREIGVPADRVHIIENWAPIDELPERPRQNQWASAHGLADRFVFLYSGTLGLKHQPELLVDLARAFREDRAVAVVVVSEGLGADWLRTQAARERLENLVLIDYQPYELLADVFAAADVLVALLEPAAGAFSVPSKVLSYLCAGRPLLASLPAENLAARTLTRARAGVVAPSGDRSAFLSAAELLRAESTVRAEMGRAARRHAEAAFRIHDIASRFEIALHAALAARHSAGSRASDHRAPTDTGARATVGSTPAAN
jgi:putative colanic acid biosynthesis glycosyltransferase WcaI